MEATLRRDGSRSPVGHTSSRAPLEPLEDALPRGPVQQLPEAPSASAGASRPEISANVWMEQILCTCFFFVDQVKEGEEKDF